MNSPAAAAAAIHRRAERGRRGTGGVARRQTRECDHACRMAQMVETAADVLLLRTQPLGSEDRIGLGGRFDDRALP